MGYRYSARRPLSRILVVESDRSTQSLVMDHLRSILQGSAISICTDTASGWSKLANGTYDLVLRASKMDNVSGLGLFNRLRSMVGYSLTPVLILSGANDWQDYSLIREFPGTQLVKKPVIKNDLIDALHKTVDDVEWILSKSEQITGLIEKVLANPDVAVAEIETILARAPSPIPLRLMLAQKLGQYELYSHAIQFYRKVLDQDQNNIQALAGAGRLLFLQGRPAEASVYLRIANNQAPGNIERLCLLGEIELNSFDTKEAKGHFSDALIHDPESEIAQAGYLIAKNFEQYINHYAQNHQWQTFASMCNTLGVFLVRKGNVDAGIRQYTSALNFLRDEPTKSRVCFNIGLGYLRWDKPEEAVGWLAKAMVNANAGAREKVRLYLDLARSSAARYAYDEDSIEFSDVEPIQYSIVPGQKAINVPGVAQGGAGLSLTDQLLDDECELSLFD